MHIYIYIYHDNIHFQIPVPTYRLQSTFFFCFFFSIFTIIKLLQSWSEDEETDRIPLQYVGLIVMEVTKVSRQKKKTKTTVCGRF